MADSLTLPRLVSGIQVVPLDTSSLEPRYLVRLYIPYSDVVPAAIRLESNLATGSVGSPFGQANGPVFYGEDTPVRVRVMVVNRGNAASAPFEVALYANGPGDGELLLTSQTLPGLPPRYEGSAWIEALWTLPATETWRLSAHVNGPTRSLSLGRRIDVNVDTLTVQPSSRPLVPPGETTTLTLTATVDNYGNVGVRDVKAEFWEGGPPGVGRRLGTAIIAELPSLASDEVRFVWPGIGTGRYEIFTSGSLPEGMPEDDLTNNQVRQEVIVVSHQFYVPFARMGLCNPTCQEMGLIRNGSFETGNFASWQVVGSPVVQEDPPHAVDGSHYAWLGMRDRAHDEIYQTITVPGRLASAVLLYAWGVYTRDTCDERSPKDRLTVSIRDAAGRTVEVLESYSECDAREFWEGAGFDLRAYAGQTIQVHFQADTDGQGPSYFALDDVHVHVCVNNP
jgi:hypothetical protein